MLNTVLSDGMLVAKPAASALGWMNAHQGAKEQTMYIVRIHSERMNGAIPVWR